MKLRSFVTTIKKGQDLTIKGGLETIIAANCGDDDETITTIDTNGAHCAEGGHTMGQYCLQN